MECDFEELGFTFALECKNSNGLEVLNLMTESLNRKVRIFSKIQVQDLASTSFQGLQANQGSELNF